MFSLFQPDQRDSSDVLQRGQEFSWVRPAVSLSLADSCAKDLSSLGNNHLYSGPVGPAAVVSGPGSSQRSALHRFHRRDASARFPSSGSPAKEAALGSLRGYDHLERGRWDVAQSVLVDVDALDDLAVPLVPYTTLFFVSLVLCSVRVNFSMVFISSL